MNEATKPHLAPPGAGLPKAELTIARLLFRLRLWRGDRVSFNESFKNERSLIRDLMHDCDASAGGRRVLIKRLRGLEDSSRFWSVWMTLDHLRIVNLAIADTISALVRGVVPSGQASTAAVKPSPEATEAVVAKYEASCDALLETVAASPDLKTAGRYAHPWFDKLDASGWHALAGMHMGIHRAQIEQILTRLAR